MNLKKTFTLIELLIVVIVIWILVVLIFKIYIQIANVSIRVENEKIMNNELLSMFQTVQNIPDDYVIDFNKYQNLKDKYWYSNILYLTWAQWPISLYSTWDCDATIDSIKTKYCWVQLDKNNQKIDLTDKEKTYFTKLYFKILPYQDVSSYNVGFEDLYHHGYAMFIESYIKKYNKSNWPFDVKVNYTNFFNLRKY